MFSRERTTNIFFLVAIAFAVYCYNPFALYFQGDDFVHIPLSAKAVFIQRNTFRPICDLSILIDYNLWGKNAWGYHIDNLLLHICCCLLVFACTKIILKKYFSADNTAAIATLTSVLFFMYPMHSEAVFWILGRSAILGTIFSLLFLICYLQKNIAGKYIFGWIFFYTLGLLTYESCWMLLPICIVISIAEVRMQFSTTKKEVQQIVLMAIIFTLYIFIRYSFIHEVTGMYESSAFLHFDVITLLKNYLLLLIRTVVPAFVNNIVLVALFVAAAIGLKILYFTAESFVRKRILAITICLLISIVPYCSLGIDTHGTEGERFLYFPSLIICLIAAILFYQNNRSLLFKRVFIPAFFSIQLITLFIVSGNYRDAGDVNKKIATTLTSIDTKNVIVATNVAQAQYGAIILRQGLPEMIRWICNKNPDTVIVQSQRSELQPLQMPYNIEFTPATEDTTYMHFTNDILQINK